jgi:hypothetical protein
MRLNLGFRKGYFNEYPTKGPTLLYLRPCYGSGVRLLGAQAGQPVLLKGKEEFSSLYGKIWSTNKGQ